MCNVTNRTKKKPQIQPKRTGMRNAESLMFNITKKDESLKLHLVPGSNFVQVWL